MFFHPQSNPKIGAGNTSLALPDNHDDLLDFKNDKFGEKLYKEKMRQMGSKYLIKNYVNYDSLNSNQTKPKVSAERHLMDRPLNRKIGQISEKLQKNNVAKPFTTRTVLSVQDQSPQKNHGEPTDFHLPFSLEEIRMTQTPSKSPRAPHRIKLDSPNEINTSHEPRAKTTGQKVKPTNSSAKKLHQFDLTKLQQIVNDTDAVFHKRHLEQIKLLTQKLTARNKKFSLEERQNKIFSPLTTKSVTLENAGLHKGLVPESPKTFYLTNQSENLSNSFSQTENFLNPGKKIIPATERNKATHQPPVTFSHPARVVHRKAESLSSTPKKSALQIPQKRLNLYRSQFLKFKIMTVLQFPYYNVHQNSISIASHQPPEGKTISIDPEQH